MEAIHDNNIGRIIKRRRVLLDITQSKLASSAGISSTLIGRVERGKRSPSARTLRKLADALHFDESELLIEAKYLSPQYSRLTEKSVGTGTMRLDPYVAIELSKEPLEVQRIALAILTMLKSIAVGIISEGNKNCINGYSQSVHRVKKTELDED